MKVLLAHRQPDIIRVVRSELEREGCVVQVVGERHEVDHAVRHGGFNLLAIESELPDGTGADVIQSLREGGCTLPILLLTPAGANEHILPGMHAGADDYLTTPCRGEEITTRVWALHHLRRGDRRDALRFGPLELDRLRRRASIGTERLSLTDLEFRLLDYLVSRADTIIGRLDLLDKIWERAPHADSNLVDVHMSRLRRKLRAVTRVPSIETIRGVGYALRQAPALEPSPLVPGSASRARRRRRH